MVCGFSVLVLLIAFICNPQYPIRVISGEASVGTWLSGALLVTAAVLSMVAGMRSGGYPWFIFTVFFAILALDERFMFHEHLKERIVFSFTAIPASWHWVYELPVLLGAGIGALVAALLWRQFTRSGRILLMCAAVLGSASVAIDVLSLGVFWEDSLKLVAELALTCALLGEVDGNG
jgi:hypothetical protein